MKKIILLFILTVFSSNNNNVYSQSDGDAAFVAGAAAFLSIYAAIEQQKELLEQQALNYILSNHPEYANFRLKVIGLGSGGRKLSDNSNSYIIPFSLVKMDGEKLTSDKKLLFLFISSNWMNQYGIDYSKWKWEIYDSNKWNYLMSEFFEVISCSKLSIINDSINIYRKQKIFSPSQAQKKGFDYLIRTEKVSKEDVDVYYEKQNNKVHISKVRMTKEGLTVRKDGKYGRKLIYPFLQLKGDDYRVKNFDSSFKIFCNENSLGLFRKDTQDAMLISRFTLRKIHTFINDDTIVDYED